MDIIVPHSWLKDYLKTTAKPERIAECFSLCGPSVERIQKSGDDTLYTIEVTTNRVDTSSVYGLAREAAAILPRFEIKASLQPVKVQANQPLTKSVDYLNVVVDHELCSRFTTVLIKDVKIGKSPDWMQDRLKKVGSRPINNIVDVSNYLMFEVGQPVHMFDYDKIKDHKMILRESKKGEGITTLDGKSHELPGGDIVIEDGSGNLIDLAGIMGGKNSAVDENTKNVLLFVQTYNSARIRKTSMTLAQRSDAASLFEKGLDPELVETTIRRGIDLLTELCLAKPENQILDLYPTPYKEKEITTTLSFIQSRLGVPINKPMVQDILISLGFKVRWHANNMSVSVPSWRANEVNLQEDILEEVARLYGYFNLPSKIMSGEIPEKPQGQPFDFEMKIKQLLKGWGGVEVYTCSLVSENKVDISGKPSWVLKLRNPLGADTEYLRLSLLPSLVAAKRQNLGQEPFFLFEMSNVYLPTRGQLPEEKMMLGGVFAGFTYQQAKGIVEAVLQELRISAKFTPSDTKGFNPNQRLEISCKNLNLGQFGILEQDRSIYFEFDVEALQKSGFLNPTYKPIPKYPGQIEDITFAFPTNTRLGEVIHSIKNSNNQIANVELVDSFENSHTFRVTYQDPEKTLTNKEVKKIREKIIMKIEKKFTAHVK